MATATSEKLNTKVVRQPEWLAARKKLLAKEKEFTRLRDELSRQRRELPWEKVEKQYVFDGPKGKVALADLFDGRSQLIVYHFMFGSGMERGMPELLVPGRQFRRNEDSSGATGCRVRGDFARDLAGD